MQKGLLRTLGIVITAIVLWAPVRVPSAWGKKGAKAAAPSLAERKRRAAELARSGREALERKDTAAAERDLFASYRQDPDPETLLQLGLLAAAERNLIAAKDCVRRYLQDPGRAATPLVSPDALRRIVEQPHGPAAELKVDGEAGGVLVLDGRPVGVLPLSGPLLVAAGERRLALETAQRAIAGTVSAPAGRLVEARFEADTESVLTTMPAAVAMLASLPAGLDGQAGFAATIERAVRRENLALYRAELAGARLKAGCLRPACAAEATEQTGAEYALLVSVESGQPSGRGFRLAVSLFDASMADMSGSLEQRCDGCSQDQASATLAEMLRQLLLQGTMRPRGTLEIASQPSGAAVWLGGHKLGTTPFRRPVWTGAHELVLRRPGYADKKVPLVVQEGKVTPITATLEAGAAAPVETPPVVAPSPPPPVPAVAAPLPGRAPRPRWRLAVGGVAIGLGVVLGGLGVSALAVNGGCIASQNPFPSPAPCPYLFNTSAAGAALLTTGLVVAAGGAVLVALPGRERPVAASLRTSSLSLLMSTD